MAASSGKSSVREAYYRIHKKFSQYRALRESAPGRRFADHVSSDFWRYIRNDVKPIPDETMPRASAAAEWLVRAQDATPDGGVSHGYFPGGPARGWNRSYPETTGYIIPSLIRFGEATGKREYIDRALTMAHWETEVQMPSGAVQGGTLRPPDKQTPAVFNTGMVLDGYSSAYRNCKDETFLVAGRKAADFLLNDLGPDNHFRTHGDFVAQNQKKTYNCLCAWSLHRFGADCGEEKYQNAAVAVVEAALKEQLPNGWFSNNCLEQPGRPLTHTIGYALQGVLEVGLLSGRSGFVDRAIAAVKQLRGQMSPNGYLAGRFDANWKPAARSSCLTGSAQIAIVCYRMAQATGDSSYAEQADRLVNLLKPLQMLDSDIPEVNGALSGSFPILGDYMFLGYPNWATKYFLDALMLQAGVGGENRG